MLYQLFFMSQFFSNRPLDKKLKEKNYRSIPFFLIVLCNLPHLQ